MTPEPLGVDSPPGPAAWSAARERGSTVFLKVMVFLSLRLGRRLSRLALYPIALYFFSFAPAARRSSMHYLRAALGRRPTARDRFRQVLAFASVVHDRVYLINERYDYFDITLEGVPLVRDQLASGRGAFLLGAHMGSFEVMRSIGRSQPGLQVTMAMYEDNARKINAILAALNPRARPDIISLGHLDAMLRISARLEQGAFVGVLGDRSLREEAAHPVTLLGRPARLPLGPLRAAALLRRSVIFMVGLYRGGNRYHVVFAPVADFSATTAGNRDTAVRVAVERYAALLDQYCRSDPYNWFNFFDFWRDDRPPS